jgi:hypothetical protein
MRGSMPGFALARQANARVETINRVRMRVFSKGLPYSQVVVTP